MEFHGAFYTPDSGQISIALEYMDGGSLADILRMHSHKRILEPFLSSMFHKLLHVNKIFLYFHFELFITKDTELYYLVFIFLKGLSYLHGVRHLVHRDIKPANLLINLKGEPKITDFGISAGLESSVAMVSIIYQSEFVESFANVNFIVLS